MSAPVVGDLHAPGAFIRFPELDVAESRPGRRVDGQADGGIEDVPAVPAMVDEDFFRDVGESGEAVGPAQGDGKENRRTDRLPVLDLLTHHGPAQAHGRRRLGGLAVGGGWIPGGQAAKGPESGGDPDPPKKKSILSLFQSQ